MNNYKLTHNVALSTIQSIAYVPVRG